MKTTAAIKKAIARLLSSVVHAPTPPPIRAPGMRKRPNKRKKSFQFSILHTMIQLYNVFCRLSADRGKILQAYYIYIPALTFKV